MKSVDSMEVVDLFTVDSGSFFIFAIVTQNWSCPFFNSFSQLHYH